jgi:hypothetical protein
MLGRIGCGTAVVLLVAAGAATARTTPPGELAPLHGAYAPKIDPASFVARIDNRYLPYKPGTRFHFEGVRGTTRQTDDQVVLRRTKRILGTRRTATATSGTWARTRSSARTAGLREPATRGSRA